MLLSCHCKSSDQISDDIKKMLSVSPIINQSDLRLHLDDVVCVIFCQKQLMRSITRSTTFHQNQNNSRNDCNQHNSSQSWANDQSCLCQKKNKKTTEIISNLIFLPIVESTLPKSYVPWWINLSLKQNLDRKKNNLMRLHSKDFSLLNKHLGWTYDWALTLSPVKNMCLVEYTKLGAYNP